MRKKDVDTTKLYDVLCVDKDADAKTMKKAYRKLCLKHHPDKGGDEHFFKEVNAAYEILSDPKKREIYDQYGLEGVEQEGAPSAAAGEDLFSMFFGGGGGRGRNAGPRKGPGCVVYELCLFFTTTLHYQRGHVVSFFSNSYFVI